MSLLSFSHGVIKIDGQPLDGILTSLSISGEVLFDEQKRDGTSGTKKEPMGWSDAEVTASLDLLTDSKATCYQRLTAINNIFKSRSDKPVVFDVVNRHMSARGIRQLYFSRLESSETDQNDVISVTLSFVEYEPAVVKAELSDRLGSYLTSRLGSVPGMTEFVENMMSDLENNSRQ